MRTEQPDNSNPLVPESKTVRHINASPKLSGTPTRVGGTVTGDDDIMLLSLQKMEEMNAQLAELVEDGRRKMTDAIATNDRFLRIVAHDLRNPLSTTISILDLLKERFDDWDKTEIKQLLDAASTSATRVVDLLENLLSWSRSQNSEKTFNPVKINLRELVINEIDRFNTSAALKQISMNHSVVPHLFVTADQQMVKTIFRNLISNAIKFSKTGGIVSISAKEGRQFIEIEVKDNGIGMSEETQKKLFKIDEFRSTLGTNNEHGTGMGLLFCKEFVGMHGGKIWVVSKPGKGSKFIFTLPRYI